MVAMKLQDIERENFYGSLTKHQIRQYFPLSINCTTLYNVFIAHIHEGVNTPFHTQNLYKVLSTCSLLGTAVYAIYTHWMASTT